MLAPALPNLLRKRGALPVWDGANKRHGVCLYVDKVASDREINELRSHPVHRSIPAPRACYNHDFMAQFFITVLGALRVFFSARGDTALEILALRQQVAVLKRQRPKPP